MATEQFILDIRVTGARRASSQINRIGKSAKATRKTLALLRSALVIVASVRIFSGIIGVLANFSQAMQTVKAVTGATANEFKILRDRAKELGATTRFTATQAAEGMVALGRAGFDTNEIMLSVGQTLTLAQAGALDLAKAAEITSGTLRGMGLAADQTQRVVDVLTFTANNSNNTVQDLGEAFKSVGPLAAGLGIDLEELASVFGVLGQRQIRASLAGTAFRRVITKLETPTGDTAKILKALGIRQEEVRISSVGLTAALERLREANVGATLAGRLFGLRAAIAGTVLATTREELEKFNAELQKVQGISQKTADIMDEGLNGAMLRAKSAAEAVLLAFGDLGAESKLTGFFDGLAGVLRILAKEIDTVLDVIGFLLTIFVVTKILAFTAAILKAAFAVKALGRAALANPIGFLAISFALVGAAAISMRDKIDASKDGTIRLNDVLKATSDLLSDTLVGAINSVGGDFENLGGFMETAARRAAEGFTGLIAVFAGLAEAVKAVFSQIKVELNNFLLGIKITVLGFKGVVNKIFTTIRLDAPFAVEDDVAAIRKLAEETVLLKVAADDVTEAFFRGGRAFLANVEAIAQERRKLSLLEFATRAGEALERKAPVSKQIVPATGGVAPEDIGLDDDATDTIKALTSSLRDLEASMFPLVAVSDRMAEVQKIINDARAEGIELHVDEAELIKRVRRAQLGAGDTIDQLREKQIALNQARHDGIITLEEEQKLSRRAALSFLEDQTDAASGMQRAFIKLTENATDAAKFTEMVFTDAFKAIEDQVISFVETGTFSFNEFFRNISRQLIRLGTQQALAGVGGFLGLGGPGQGFGVRGPSGSSIAGIGGLLTSLLPFQRGGAFTVGANTAVQSIPGIDNRLIAFRARDGEEVTVTPKAAGGAGAVGPTNIIFNVQTKDADSFVRSQSQLQNRALAGINTARRRR